MAKYPWTRHSKPKEPECQILVSGPGRNSFTFQGKIEKVLAMLSFINVGGLNEKPGFEFTGINVTCDPQDVQHVVKFARQLGAKVSGNGDGG